jgi:hypothetical protein
MKIFLFLSAVVFFSIFTCIAQTQSVSTVPSPTPYTIVSRDANSQIWQRTVYERGPSGQVVPHNKQYTELAMGLNFRDPATGQWGPSKDEIDILSDGSAAATNGQYQVYFPVDIYNGIIRLTTLDGLQIESQPIGLSYDDGTNSVLFAELTNSVGQLISPNQILYPNAFVGINADLLYTYTKAGFEQDVILEGQPPAPESYGIDSQTARLQLITEFFNPPQPSVSTTTLPEQAGLALPDTTLDFGTMEIIQGRAFLLGTNLEEGQVMVGKQWVSVDGRQLLVEEVPVAAIQTQLSELPTAQTSSIKANSQLKFASVKCLLPAQRLGRNTNKNVIRLSQAKVPKFGLLLDYQTINGKLTNYTFQADTTYYISGPVNCYGTNIFEGGAVLKYTNAPYPRFAELLSTSGGQFNWLTAAYRPVIFTAIDDNSVGDDINGSTGHPIGYYANPALQFSGSAQYFRIAYAHQAITEGDGTFTLSNGQIINCGYGVADGATSGSMVLTLENLLFANVQTNLNLSAIASGGAQINVLNTTFALSSALVGENPSDPDFGIYVTNCILADVTNAGCTVSGTLYGGYNGFYNSFSFGSGPNLSSGFYPFQTVGAGGYYLTNGCNFQGQGTTNIEPDLLTDLSDKTTYPPIIYSNLIISIPMTFAPVVQRDNIGTPDLGYHYDPLDYLLGGICVTNANITVDPGTAIGCFGLDTFNDDDPYSLDVEGGGALDCQGLATELNYIAEYNSVQEGLPATNWGLPNSAPYLVSDFEQSAPTGSLFNFRFTDFSSAVQDYQELGFYNYNSSTLYFRDCEIYGGYNGGGSVNITNCLFSRSFTGFIAPSGQYSMVYNNLFYGGVIVLGSILNVTNTTVINNLFDMPPYTSGIVFIHLISPEGGYNDYYSPPFTNTYFSTDLLLTNAPIFQNGPFGEFYQPSNSVTIYAGNTNANLLGLYHYTVTTNEIIDGNNRVSIGYHYVATTNGVPIDSNGDGIPDYIEDANGNGIDDSGETAWDIPGDLGFSVIITKPRNNNIIP